MNSKKIKKEIKLNSLFIRLYNPECEKIKGIDSSNIQAFNPEGKLLWTVQPPTYNEYYYDIQIDEDSFTLDADGGTGRIYKINLGNGAIVSSQLIK